MRFTPDLNAVAVVLRVLNEKGAMAKSLPLTRYKLKPVLEFLLPLGYIDYRIGKQGSKLYYLTPKGLIAVDYLNKFRRGKILKYIFTYKNKLVRLI